MSLYVLNCMLAMTSCCKNLSQYYLRVELDIIWMQTKDLKHHARRRSFYTHLSQAKEILLLDHYCLPEKSKEHYTVLILLLSFKISHKFILARKMITSYTWSNEKGFIPMAAEIKYRMDKTIK